MTIRRRDGRGRHAQPGPAAAARQRRRLAATVVVVAVASLALVASACSTSATSGGDGTTGDPSPTQSPTVPSAKVRITPGNGSHSAKTTNGITVTVEHGTLVKVSAHGDGGTVDGAMNDTSTSWRSDWALSTGTQYVVHVTAVDAAGRKVTRTSRFRTLVPHSIAYCQIFEGSGQTYGVGMPVMLTFTKSVQNKQAVEKALVLQSSKPVVGAWYWDGDKTLWFRPRKYWPQDIQLSFTGHLDGVQVAPGVYTTHTLTQSWNIGRSLILVANAVTHHMKVYKDRKLYATWPISTGRPGKDTPNGTYLSIEKANPQHMVGPGYNLEVPYSVRFTWSGDFVHAASWSVAQQGFVNVSHGCVNVGPSNAALYYSWSIPGDPITVTGSPKAGTWDDGYTCWFLSWKQLWKGSATHMAVRVNQDGSTFVKPSDIKPSHAKAPLGKPKSDNAAAS